MKSICVLISTYNGQRYLQEQLNSLYAQRGVRLTILARDDGSTDRSVEILGKYSFKNIKRAKLVQFSRKLCMPFR